MEAQILTTVATGALLAMFTAILAWQGKGRLDAIERQLEQVRFEIGSLRSDLTTVALAVGAKPRPQTG